MVRYTLAFALLLGFAGASVAAPRPGARLAVAQQDRVWPAETPDRAPDSSRRGAPAVSASSIDWSDWYVETHTAAIVCGLGALVQPAPQVEWKAAPPAGPRSANTLLLQAVRLQI